MIKGVNIKCTDGEMREILDFIIATNKYQLPKDVVFIIKEDKPKFPFFKRVHKTQELIEDNENIKSSGVLEVEEPIIDANFKEVKEEEDSSEEPNDKEEKKVDNDDSFKKETEGEINALKESNSKLLEKLNEFESSLKEMEKSKLSLEKAKLEMSKTIKRLQKENTSIIERNNELLESRNDLLTIMRDNVESFENEELQDRLIKLYFTEVVPEDDIV